MPLIDAINSYRLFLGRDPETEQVAEERGRIPLRDSLAGFIVSEEFAGKVLGALSNGSLLPHFTVSPFPSKDLIKWVGATLPVTAETRALVSQAMTWRQLLVYVLLDPDFFQQIGRFAGSKPYIQFREKYPDPSVLDAGRGLTGAISSYRLFLGRDPETEKVAAERSQLPLRDSLAGFIASGEFTDKVLDALFHHGSLPHFAISPFVPEEIVNWVGAALPIADETRSLVSRAKSWRQLLIAVLLDPAFFEQIGRFAENRMYGQFREKYSKANLLDEGREIAGAIDEVSTFEVRGWAANLMDLSEAIQIEFLLDNVFLGVGQCGQFRADAQGKVGGAGLHGFAFIIPAAHQHLLQTERLLTVRDAASRATIATPMRIHVGQAAILDALIPLRRELATVAAALKQIEKDLPPALIRAAYPLAMYDDYHRDTRRVLAINRTNLEAASAALPHRPLVSVVVVGNANDTFGLARSVRSMQRQIYENWECIVCDQISEGENERKSLIDKFTASDSRIRRVKGAAGLSPSQLMNQAAGAAKGAYAVVLAEGDTLTEDALLTIGQKLQEAPFRLAYFDEDVMELDPLRNETYREPKLKPAFDYDFLLASGYIGGAFAFDRLLFDEVGGFRGDFGAALFLDLLLRMIERVDRGTIAHIARVLHHRVESAELGTPAQSSDAEDAAKIACLNAHLGRVGLAGVAAAHSDPLGIARPRCRRIAWKLPDPAPKVSIIIPTRDQPALLQQCVHSVLASQPAYPARYEIIVMDNDSAEPKTHELFAQFAAIDGVRVVRFSGSFNWSAINNAAARQAKGDVLVFLNNDTVVLSPDWVRELASTLSRPDAGVVGARLLYEDGTIQHAGVLLGVAGGAVHEGVGQAPTEGGYLGRTALQHNVLAVTGACLATRASTFHEFGGFDEANLRIEFSDIDYCLKVHDKGLAVLYTPFATLYHFESKSRGYATTVEKNRRSRAELMTFAGRWRKYLERDPFYNPHFDRFSRPFSRLQPVVMLESRIALGSERDEPWREL